MAGLPAPLPPPPPPMMGTAPHHSTVVGLHPPVVGAVMHAPPMFSAVAPSTHSMVGAFATFPTPPMVGAVVHPPPQIVRVAHPVPPFVGAVAHQLPPPVVGAVLSAAPLPPPAVLSTPPIVGAVLPPVPAPIRSVPSAPEVVAPAPAAPPTSTVSAAPAAPASPAAPPAPAASAANRHAPTPATEEEVENFITANSRWIEEAGATELRKMSPEDQRRVMAGGTLVSCRDAVGVMRSRVRQAKEKETILSGAHLSNPEAGGVGGKLSRPASKEEVQGFLASNSRWLNPEAEEILKMMNPLDQKRVINGGTLSGCRDPVAVLQTRAKRAREMEVEFELIASGKKPQGPKVQTPAVNVPHFSAEAASAFVYARPEEVQAENSRFASAVGTDDDDETSPLSSNVRGIGGVVEMVRAKYGCSKGQRLQVIGETSALLQFEGGKTAPKNHEGTGWKWVIEEVADSARQAEAEKQKKAEEAVRQSEMQQALKAREGRIAREAMELGQKHKSKDKSRSQSRKQFKNGKQRASIRANGKEKERRGKDKKRKASSSSTSSSSSSSTSTSKRKKRKKR